MYKSAAVAACAMLFASMPSGAAAQDYSTVAHIDSEFVPAIVQAAETVWKSGVPLDSLSTFSLAYGTDPAGNAAVILNAPNGRSFASVFSNGNSKAVGDVTLTSRQTLSGVYVATLTAAFPYWKQVAARDGYTRSAWVGFERPFSSAPSLYYVYFVPTQHYNVSYRCSTDQGFSVNEVTWKVRTFKRIC